MVSVDVKPHVSFLPIGLVNAVKSVGQKWRWPFVVHFVLIIAKPCRWIFIRFIAFELLLRLRYDVERQVP